jgi:S-adenosylmethionine:tRNA ribosyltransferase-isomerase
MTEIRRVREEGGRVIAVGTTALRALESCPVSGYRSIHGRTNIYIRPGFKFKMVDGLITGLHEPDGSHVDLVSALVDESTLLSAYSVATELGYNWHEFGDISLIV